MKKETPCVGRIFEQEKIESIKNSKEASILVVYGRRRVGKTFLLEHSFQSRNLLKFEGVEGLSQEDQIETFLYQLAKFAKAPHIAKIKFNRWMEVFDYLATHVQNGVWTLYFEEVQWMANYSDEFVSDLKYSWDNSLSRNPNLILILCGSAPSFIINKILRSKSLYNRSQHEIHLQEFSLTETREFLGKNTSHHEAMDAHLLIGGIPEYLKYLKSKSSVFTSLCEHAFKRDGFFSNEFERIFISSLSKNKHYKKIISFLAKNRFATRNDIATKLKIPIGGGLSNLLDDLELSGFVRREVPFNLQEGSMLSRYAIDDAYLQFYYKFIDPIKSKIAQGDYNQNPERALNLESLRKWMGFSFERFCRKNHQIIAGRLGFKNVEYRHGVFFNRQTLQENRGYQIDLLFDRNDKVVTICEIKYYQTQVGAEVIEPFEQRIRKLPPQFFKKTIQKVLICPHGATENLKSRRYFDSVLTLEDLFHKSL